MLGLMLVTPSKRERGLGRYFHEQIVKFVQERHGNKIRIHRE